MFDSIIASYEGPPPRVTGGSEDPPQRRRSAAEYHDHMTNQKQTVKTLRKVGNAFMSWLDDQIAAGRSGVVAIVEQDAEPGWSIRPKGSEKRMSYVAIPHATVRELLVPDYVDAVPEKDGWGRPYEIVFNPGLVGHVFGIRSSGGDGLFETDDYEVGDFFHDDFDQDIVWCDGYFVRWPTAKKTGS